jgi:hypothetical protein
METEREGDKKKVKARHRRGMYISNPVHTTYIIIGDASH